MVLRKHIKNLARPDNFLIVYGLAYLATIKQLT